jgi:hypothetical protein
MRKGSPIGNNTTKTRFLREHAKSLLPITTYSFDFAHFVGKKKNNNKQDLIQKYTKKLDNLQEEFQNMKNLVHTSIESLPHQL